MKYAKPLICAIPAACWDSKKKAQAPWNELQTILSRCLICQRRLKKGVNSHVEERIYQSLLVELSRWLVGHSQAIKSNAGQKANLSQNKLPGLALGGAYHQLLIKLDRIESRRWDSNIRWDSDRESLNLPSSRNI